MLEGQNITFEWRYTLDGTILFAMFHSITASGARNEIARIQSKTIVQPNFQKRFTVDISVTQTKITLLAVQMSDDRKKFELGIITSNFKTIVDGVELIVQCK